MRISYWSSDVCSSDLRQNENLFVDASGQWAPDTYIPAFVRRYLFVLAEKPAAKEGDDFTVFLDEQYEGFKIGRTSGRAIVRQYLYVSVVAGTLKKTENSIY